MTAFGATVIETAGYRVLLLPAEGALIAEPADATELVGAAWGEDVSAIAVPVARLHPSFFDLRSGLAGELAQKLVNYRLRFLVVGDVAPFEAGSSAFRDWVRESNAGREVWFVTDVAELEERLARG
jgi:hypothetical protein